MVKFGIMGNVKASFSVSDTGDYMYSCIQRLLFPGAECKQGFLCYSIRDA